MANKLKNLILVPTDFSQTCQNAIDHAVTLAEVLQFKVTLLHVINRDTRHKLGNEATGKTVEDKLEAIVSEIRKKSKIKVDYLYREGSIFDIINEVSSELKANFMVLGTHGKKGLQYLIGSFALRVVSHSLVPVIVVQKKKMATKGYFKISFPIGIYTEARQKVKYAITLSKLFNSEILIFQQPSTDPGASSRVNIITRQIQEEFDKYKVKYSVKKAEKEAQFASQVIDFSVENYADLILMMTDSNIDHPDFNNSSWSERLMFNEAQIPVLCINPVYLGEIYYSF